MSQKAWNVDEMLYKLMVENNSSYSQDCHFCGNYHCRKHCPVPFRDDMTVLDMLHKVGSEDNISYYSSGQGKSDFILNIVWHEDFQKEWQTHLSSMVKALINEEASNNREADEDGITMQDCFQEFRKEEILDQDNKWYCNKCKEHVQATKQLEIYKAPPILIINLKRFKQSK